MSASRSFQPLIFCGLSGLVELKILNCQIVYESVHLNTIGEPQKIYPLNISLLKYLSFESDKMADIIYSICNSFYLGRVHLFLFL